MDIGKLGMFAAILIFHTLIIRQFIEGMIYRRFDLYGGEYTKEGVECISPTDPDCTGMIGDFI
jgi:hypothetical protein